MATIKTIQINAHVRDCFSATSTDTDGKEYDYQGYVPSWMPGECYGDDFTILVDNETGRILNWTPVHINAVKEEEN